MNFRKLIILILAFFLNYYCFSQKYSGEVLEYKTDYTLKGNELLEHVVIKIKINKREGDKYSSFAIPYHKNRKLNDFNAHLENSNGDQIRKLKKSEAFDRSAFTDGLYTDHFIKAFQLTCNEYPYVFVCEFESTIKNIMSICNWEPDIYNEIPILNASLSVTMPKGYAYKKLIKGNLKEISEQLPDGVTRLSYVTTVTTPLKDEIYALPSCNMPSVEILPLTFYNEYDGSWESWQTYGSWISKLNTGMDELPENEKVKVDKLINGVKDKKEITRILYHYLQDNSRYVNVSIGIGALMPYPAEYVCKNRYGDCKALTNYMKALLKYAGIESYYCVINASDQVEPFNVNFPSHQFNHAILAAVNDNDTIWLENTSNINPFGYMGTYTQNRYALLVNGNESKLVRVPALNKWQSGARSRLEFNLDLDGNATAKLCGIYTGDLFDYFNSLSNILNEKDRDEYIRNSISFENSEVIDWEIIKTHRDSLSIALNVNLKARKLLNKLGNDYYISITSSDIPAFTNTANRTMDVMLPYPIFLSDTLIYNLPDSYSPIGIAEPLIIESSYGTYKLNISSIDQSVVCVKEFELYAGHYSLVEYPELYKFMQSVYKAEKSKLIIKHL